MMPVGDSRFAPSAPASPPRMERSDYRGSFAALEKPRYVGGFFLLIMDFLVINVH